VLTLTRNQLTFPRVGSSTGWDNMRNSVGLEKKKKNKPLFQVYLLVSLRRKILIRIFS
jgi:hypothetical protein